MRWWYRTHSRTCGCSSAAPCGRRIAGLFIWRHTQGSRGQAGASCLSALRGAGAAHPWRGGRARRTSRCQAAARGPRLRRSRPPSRPRLRRLQHLRCTVLWAAALVFARGSRALPPTLRGLQQRRRQRDGEPRQRSQGQGPAPLHRASLPIRCFSRGDTPSACGASGAACGDPRGMLDPGKKERRG